ncbi:putative F-box/kelch-repeat protein [Raphanus sativus]|nr:putative F-box/kelch-repeat protein [Raphanus sativus]
MEPGEAQPQTKPLSRGWYALKNAKGYLHHYLLIFFTLIHKTISTFAPTTTAIHSDVEPPSPHEHPSFSSLPDYIIVNCLARISRSYYPKLSLVSKAFRSLISSDDLYAQRLNLKTTEALLHVCLQLPSHRLPSWFILPDQVLTNNMEEKFNKSPRNTLLVGMHSSYIRHAPKIHIGWVGSRFYKVTQFNTDPTFSPLLFRNKGSETIHEAPCMKVARTNPVAGIIDGKIYVMGGCSANEATSWAEVFDTKTQVWEPLPDPGADLRFSIIKTLKVAEGKVYVESSEKNDYFMIQKKVDGALQKNHPWLR